MKEGKEEGGRGKGNEKEYENGEEERQKKSKGIKEEDKKL